MKKYSSLLLIFSLLCAFFQVTSFYLFWKFHWDIHFLIPVSDHIAPSLESLNSTAIIHLASQLTLNFVLAHFLLIQVKDIKSSSFFAHGLLVSCLFNIFSGHISYYTGMSSFKLASLVCYQLFFVGVLVLIFKSLKSDQDIPFTIS